jgi:hypothetical protein
MEFKVAIVSHNRVDTLRKRTLATLERYKIPKSMIYIFVAPDELETYRAAFDGYWVVSGGVGLQANRGAIHDFFPEDTPVFCMDDDIRGFVEKDGDRSKPLDDFSQMVQKGFQKAADNAATLWGLYPVSNGKFMRYKTAWGLVFCYGCAYGFYSKKGYKTTLDFKDDYERSCLFYERDGRNIRLEWVSPLQTYMKGDGGLNAYRTNEKEKEDCEKLKKLFPKWVKYKEAKGKWTVRLSDPDQRVVYLDA